MVQTVATLILGAILGAVLEALFGIYLSRAKLSVTGGTASSGGPNGASQHAARIGNRPAFLGINIGATTFLGLRIAKPRRWGLSLERQTAHDVQGRFIDESGAFIAPLWWQMPNGDYRRGVISLASREDAMLMLFAHLPGEDGYVIFDMVNGGHTPSVAPGAQRFRDDVKVWTVEVVDADERKLRFKVTVRREPTTGGFRCESLAGGVGI